MTVDRAYLLLRVSPWQCLTSPLLVGLPFPSHPTVRSVFPSTAVRQSSSPTMHRFRQIFEHAAANVDEPHRIACCSESVSIRNPGLYFGVKYLKTDVDETLQPAESLAGVGMPEVVDPPQHHRIHHLHESFGLIGARLDGHVLQTVPNFLLGGLGWEHVDGLLTATGTAAFHKVKPNEIKPIGHPCHVSCRG